jgi:hypothetical protein
MIILHIGIDHLTHHIDKGILPDHLPVFLHRFLVSLHMRPAPVHQFIFCGSYQLTEEILLIFTMAVDTRSSHTAAIGNASHGRFLITSFQKFLSGGRHYLNMIYGLISWHGFDFLVKLYVNNVS